MRNGESSNSKNDDNSNDSPRNRAGLGRRKVEIKKIEEKTPKVVTFSKRRSGLFKKTMHVTEICRKKAAVVTFSPNDKPYAVGYPSVDSVVEAYLRKEGGGEREEEVEEGFWWERGTEGLNEKEAKKFKDALIVFRGSLEARIADLRFRDEHAKKFF